MKIAAWCRLSRQLSLTLFISRIVLCCVSCLSRMPLIENSNNSECKRHSFPAENGKSLEPNMRNTFAHDYSKSLNNLSDSCKEKFIPRSISSVQESPSGWKLSFCGVIPSHDCEIDIRKSVDFDSCNSDVSRFSSAPIPVPLRESRKRKSNLRSSGGYFFDKYMKRFRAKYDAQKSLSYSETIDELKVSQFHKKKMLKVHSNRDDLVWCRGSWEECGLLDEVCLSIDDSLSDDDLYPLRYGTSSEWSLQLPCNPNNSATSESEVLKVDANNLVGNEVSSVFPSPLCFWGDASGGIYSDFCNELASPVPSLTDAGGPACRYSDSNSETLKAMETLYLCNFQVAVEGDWLCLKEINEESVKPTLLVANSLAGIYRIFVP